MIPMLDHIHITVEDIDRAEKFYDKLLPLLGFDLSLKEYDAVPENEYRIVEYHNNLLSIGIVNQREAYKTEKASRRKAGVLHHIAFHVDSTAEINELYKKIKEIPATIIHAPQYYPEYCPDYYALFFKDSEGIEFELVSFNRKKYFPQ